MSPSSLLPCPIVEFTSVCVCLSEPYQLALLSQLRMNHLNTLRYERHICLYLSIHLIISHSLTCASNGQHYHLNLSDVTGLCAPEAGALGMESGEIANSALQASSSHVVTYVGPQFARLNRDQNGGAWCPLNPIEPDNPHSEWIEVRFAHPVVVVAIATQGRYGQGHGIEFMSHYHVLYTREIDNILDWILWKNVHGNSDIKGNEDTNATRTHVFQPALVGVRRLRVLPVSNQTRTVCLRFELYGCAYHGPLAYAITNPAGQAWWMQDNGYDGKIISVATAIYQLQGLGQLVDGMKVTNNSMLAHHADGWVGWPGLVANESHHLATADIRLEFQFDQITNFSSVSLNSRASHSQPDILVSISIDFSLDNRTWTEHSIQARYVIRSNHTREIIVQLFSLIGAFVRIDLSHNATRFLMDEVSFDCKPLDNTPNDPAMLEHAFKQLDSSPHVLQEEKPNLGIRYTMGDDGYVPTTPDMGIINWQKMSIILCICILGLVIVLLVASFILRKVSRRERDQDHPELKDYSNDVLTLSQKFPAIYETPKMFVSAGVASPGTLKLNSRFYASADFVQNASAPRIYESPKIGKLAYPGEMATPPKSTTTTTSPLYQLAPAYAHDIVNNNLNFPAIHVYSETEVKILKTLGKSRFGDILLGSLRSVKVTIRTINETEMSPDFMEMVKHLQQLSRASERIVRMHGIMHTPHYLASLVEHTDCNLHCYLRQQQAESVDYEMLLYFLVEMATACVHLEQADQVHGDLAARNFALQGKRLKLGDMGFFLEEFADDYHQGNLPIRWMSGEAIFMSKLSTKSDVHAFGVCCWEVLTLAACKPYHQLSDAQYLQARECASHEKPKLSKPQICSPELYGLMLKCCNARESSRPSFEQILHFLQQEINLLE